MRWVLQQNEEFCNNIMWSDEKQTNKMSDSGLTMIPMLKLIVSSKEEEISCAGLA